MPSQRNTAATQSKQLYLVLRRDDGSAWTLRFSSGVERFIGAYPRVPGFDCGDPLITFRTIDIA
jgi:hypothetical protein